MSRMVELVITFESVGGFGGGFSEADGYRIARRACEFADDLAEDLSEELAEIVYTVDARRVSPIQEG